MEVIRVDTRTFTILMSYWDEFLRQRTRFDAMSVVEVMKNFIATLDNEKSILKPFKPYFDDPAMVCEYGLTDVPAKHRGPAEVEGLFDKYKNDYLARLSSKSKLDDILYEHRQYRQMLSHRYRLTAKQMFLNKTRGLRS